MNSGNQNPQDLNQSGSGFSHPSEQSSLFNTHQRESAMDTIERQHAHINQLRSLLLQTGADKDKQIEENKKLRELLAMLLIKYWETRKQHNIAKQKNEISMDLCADLISYRLANTEQARNRMNNNPAYQAAVAIEQRRQQTMTIHRAVEGDESSPPMQVDHEGSTVSLEEQPSGSNESQASVIQMMGQSQGFGNCPQDDSGHGNQQLFQGIAHSHASYSLLGMISNEGYGISDPASF